MGFLKMRWQTPLPQRGRGWGPLFGLIVTLLLAACGRPGQPATPVYLKAAGSTAMAPLMRDLAQAYGQRHRYTSIDVEGGGSTLGLEMAGEGLVDFGLVSREVSDDEKLNPQTGQQRLWATVIARDGIAIVVHPGNPLPGLTLLQLRDVFYGRVFDWQDTGGTAGEIVVISREDGSGTRQAFEERVMGGRRVTPTAVVMPGSQAVVDYVAAHPLAVGYVSMGYLSPGVRALPIESLTPTPENVRSGEYHLTRPLVVVTGRQPAGEVRAFLDFALSPAGQAVVGERYGRVR